jgi:transposase
MDAIIERCAGLDVHQRTVVACILYGPLDRKPKQLVRTFGTTTRELLSLLDWLTEYEVTHVAMESSGVYWKPVWNILEGDFTLILANAQRIKNVPGRKTDVNDAVWIAQLLRCGHGASQGYPASSRLYPLPQKTAERRHIRKKPDTQSTSGRQHQTDHVYE